MDRITERGSEWAASERHFGNLVWCSGEQMKRIRLPKLVLDGARSEWIWFVQVGNGPLVFVSPQMSDEMLYIPGRAEPVFSAGGGGAPNACVLACLIGGGYWFLQGSVRGNP